jgi:DNA mismatch endonuclease (patch repair protein)
MPTRNGRQSGPPTKFGSKRPADAESRPLTKREREVVEWIAAGKRNAEIGKILGCSSRTVQKHVQHILEKLHMGAASAGLFSGQCRENLHTCTYRICVHMDVFSPKNRSEIMRRVRSKNTKPEMVVRRLVHSSGFRYRVHSKTVFGCPDLVFAGPKKAIFVHGCFWHGHDCPSATLPKTNRQYWQAKQERNAMRDARNLQSLRGAGWRVLIIWECELKELNKLKNRLQLFLEP